MNNTNINLDAIFEGKPFDKLDALTQEYVLKEFGSRTEYEAMTSSFKRIRAVINEEEEIVADDKVKKNLMALFDKDDEKVVPLIPNKTNPGMSFLRSPYFQMGVAASLVIVALFFIPWGGTNNDQLAMNSVGEDHSNTKSADMVISKTEGDNMVVTDSNGNKSYLKENNRKENANNNVLDEESAKDRRRDADKVQEELMEAPSENAPISLSEVEGEKRSSEKEIDDVVRREKADKKEEGKGETNFAATPNYSNTTNGNSVNTITTTDAKISTKENKKSSNSRDLSKSKVLETTPKKKVVTNNNLAGSKDEDNTNSKITAGANVPASEKLSDKKAVTGISLGDNKDVMQFFYTAL